MNISRLAPFPKFEDFVGSSYLGTPVTMGLLAISMVFLLLALIYAPDNTPQSSTRYLPVDGVPTREEYDEWVAIQKKKGAWCALVGISLAVVFLFMYMPRMAEYVDAVDKWGGEKEAYIAQLKQDRIPVTGGRFEDGAYVVDLQTDRGVTKARFDANITPTEPGSKPYVLATWVPDLGDNEDPHWSNLQLYTPALTSDDVATLRGSK